MMQYSYTKEYPDNLPKGQIGKVAIFASYNSQQVIEDDVLYYLSELKKVADVVIFIADNQLKQGELDKIQDIVVYAYFNHHGFYDFGSYREGINWLRYNNLLDKTDEIILANDSCYGPIFPFSDSFEKMKNKKCDFWGLIDSEEVEYHLQSYFMVFKKHVFLSELFQNFFRDIKHFESSWDYVINYETKLTGLLMKAGYHPGVLIKNRDLPIENDKPWTQINPSFFPISLIDMGGTLIKKKIFAFSLNNMISQSIPIAMTKIKLVNPAIYNIIESDLGKRFGRRKSLFLTDNKWKRGIIELEWIMMSLYSKMR